METELLIEIVIAVVAICSFIGLYSFSPTFRNQIHAYLKKAWRENRQFVFGIIDERINDIASEVNVEISKRTDKYIRYEILKRFIDNKVNIGSEHAAEWVKLEYKIILEDIIEKSTE